MNDEFLGGVIEGFYGKPWKHSQRLAMVDQLASWRLNTYFYAPKDDLKHRALWRECYEASEIDALAEVAERCQKQNVNFIYGISPGLDIRFGDPAELQILQQRLQQMMDIERQSKHKSGTNEEPTYGTNKGTIRDSNAQMRDK